MRGAGTSAKVSITLFGTSGKDSGEHLLDSGSTNFERGKTDIFQISTLDIGDLKVFLQFFCNAFRKSESAMTILE